MTGTVENESCFSTTAANNASADSNINWAEGQAAASVNNSARSMMAARAKARLDQGGGLTAGGSANALTVTTNQVLASGQLTAGLRICLKAASTNTSTTVTFAPDSLTAQAIKRADGSALAVGSIQAGMFLDLVYNSGTTEWWAANINPAQVPAAPVTLSDGATPALNAALGNLFRLTTTTNPTIAVPTNPVDGQTIVIQVTASGGARTMSLNTGAGGFIFGADIAALSQTTSGKTDYVGCIYDAAASGWRVLAYTKGF